MVTRVLQPSAAIGPSMELYRQNQKKTRLGRVEIRSLLASKRVLETANGILNLAGDLIRLTF
jgi:hypothetical protein